MGGFGFTETQEIPHTMAREPTSRELMSGARESCEETARPDLAPSYSILEGILAGGIVRLCNV